MADSASSSRAVMAQSAPTSLPTACSVSVARSTTDGVFQLMKARATLYTQCNTEQWRRPFHQYMPWQADMEDGTIRLRKVAHLLYLRLLRSVSASI